MNKVAYFVGQDTQAQNMVNGANNCFVSKNNKFRFRFTMKKNSRLDMNATELMKWQ